MAPAVVVDMIEFEKLRDGFAATLTDVAAIGSKDFVPELPMRPPEVLPTMSTRLSANNRGVAART
jgi:hypothetical protein